MEGPRLPPSPRERPPPGPSPRGKGIGASPERDAAARRSLTTSLTSSVPPHPVPGTAIGDGDERASDDVQTCLGVLRVSTKLLRYPDAKCEDRTPGRRAPACGGRSSPSASGLVPAAGVSPSGAYFDGLRDAMRAARRADEARDAQTAELLAAQQGQLSELNEQLRSLQSQLRSLRRSGGGGGRPSGGADDDDTFRDGSSARAMRSPRFGVGESAGSGFTNASRESGSRFSAASSSGHSKRSSDAATNTVWAAPGLT